MRLQTNSSIFRALKMRQEGYTYAHIGDHFDISRQLALQWIRKAEKLEVAYKEVND